MNNPNICGQSRLQEAIRRYEASLYASMPQSEEPIRYSSRYRRRMRKLCGNLYARPALPAIGIQKYAAVALLTALLLVTSIFSISATRTAVSEWFINIYESFTEIFSPQRGRHTAPDSIEKVYFPSGIPDGYFLEDNYLAQNESKFTWENENGDRIFFIQTPLHSKTTVDNEETEQETTWIGEVKCLFTRKNGKTCVYWNNREYAFSLIASKELTREEYTEIITSVTERRAS
ncbi:MAG: DUF4367 domain-containing protein [Clostridia bacterium]|nr:DUF4367 domain-containing protein [Clostridia bacterium]MBR6743705.1 DUF4367 domain-containing protein [Clostridia bacterium]